MGNGTEDVEHALLERLQAAAEPLGLPEPADLRGVLATNPEARPWSRRDIGALRGLVWHQELGWGSIEAVAQYHSGPESHLAEGGVESIAYSWAIRRNGQLALCNDLDRATWSQGYRSRPGDENAQFMALMFEGLFNGRDVTDPSAGEPNDVQMLAALMLWQACKAQWDWNAGDLYGHFDFGKPACPGNSLQVLIESVRASAGSAADFDLGTVKGRQGALRELGYYQGEIDGLWGPRSKGALTRFQRDHDLVADGVFGTRSRAAMDRVLR